MKDKAKAAMNKLVKLHIKRDSYNNYMDGSNWRQLLLMWRTIVLPSIEAGDGWLAGAVPEATLLCPPMIA